MCCLLCQSAHVHASHALASMCVSVCVYVYVCLVRPALLSRDCFVCVCVCLCGEGGETIVQADQCGRWGVWMSARERDREREKEGERERERVGG